MLKDKQNARGGGAGSGRRERADENIYLSSEALRDILARGDVREMRRVEANLRRWLRGTNELVDELERLIVELEEPRR